MQLEKNVMSYELLSAVIGNTFRTLFVSINYTGPQLKLLDQGLKLYPRLVYYTNRGYQGRTKTKITPILSSIQCKVCPDRDGSMISERGILEYSALACT